MAHATYTAQASNAAGEDLQHFYWQSTVNVPRPDLTGYDSYRASGGSDLAGITFTEHAGAIATTVSPIRPEVRPEARGEGDTASDHWKGKSMQVLVQTGLRGSLSVR